MLSNSAPVCPIWKGWRKATSEGISPPFSPPGAQALAYLLHRGHKFSSFPLDPSGQSATSHNSNSTLTKTRGLSRAETPHYKAQLSPSKGRLVSVGPSLCFIIICDLGKVMLSLPLALSYFQTVSTEILRNQNKEHKLKPNLLVGKFIH